MIRQIAACVALFAAQSVQPAQSTPTARTPSAVASGDLTLRGEVRGSLPDAPVILRCYKLRVTESGRTIRLTKREFFHREPNAATLAEGGRFAFESLDAGRYSIVAFQDLDGDGRPSYDNSEPLGWFCSEAGGYLAHVGSGDPAKLQNGLSIELRRTRRFPARRRIDGVKGELTTVRGIPTLRLWGTAEERGRAHGRLVAPQILDFFTNYILEDKFKSPKKYESTFVPFLKKNIQLPGEFRAELDAVITGMKESGVSMRIATLGRDFDRTDLLAINAYIESRAMRSSCTQFAFWGSRTKGTDVDGGLIAGRNMDGEIDLRKTTVSHFLVFAVDQKDKDRRRYLSLMWPGFVGTITGINEDGLYAMENAGGTGPGPVVTRVVPISWTQRFVLENVVGAVSPDAIERVIDAFHSSGGGSCGPGCIILFAAKFAGQKAPAFVFEGDRFGGELRLPNEVRPFGKEHIMASNHHLKYGVHADSPGKSFGKTGSFSSRWRYEAGAQTVESWQRLGRRVGTAEMRRLLQTVSHGTTEHSIIFRPSQMTLDIAVDDLAADMWDAPHRKWVRFGFDEFFAAR